MTTRESRVDRSPRVLVVEHQATCPPALLGEWLADAGCTLTVVRPWSGDTLPAASSLGEWDAMVVLGGEMGAYDDHAHPWLTDTKRLLREAATAGVPTLGVCLGHQLTAVALGGRVERNPHGQAVGLQRIGWTRAASDDPLLGPVAAAGEVPGIHWNNDVVTELPPGAVPLAHTPDGAPQVVRFAPRSWGVQLHPEADEGVVRAWAEGDRADHLERGIDTDGALARIRAAHADLEAAWRPLALRLAELARVG